MSKIIKKAKMDLDNDDDEEQYDVKNAFVTLFIKSSNIENAKRVLLRQKYIEEVEIGEEKTTFVCQQSKWSHIRDPVETMTMCGVAIIEVIREDELEEYQKMFHKAMSRFREYKIDPENPSFTSTGIPLVYSAGGFAAFANPSSFHNEFVRRLRIKAYSRTIPFFTRLIRMFKDKRDLDMKIEILPDRMMFRRAGQAPTPEAWHRDVMINEQIGEDDEIFGGWINLDSHPQYFSFIPGSHLGVSIFGLETGFAVIKNKEGLSDKKVRIEIPPGHILIFPQYLIHEVVANKSPHDMMRLFTGYRLTTLDTSIYMLPDPNDKRKTKNKERRDMLNEILDNQAVPQLPGGMIPPMYSQHHQMSFLNNPFFLIPNNNAARMTLIQWSDLTFDKKVIVTRVNGNTDKEYELVARHMKSLKEYGFKLYAPYSEAERKLYFPHKILH
jgi:hypothetical protein